MSCYTWGLLLLWVATVSVQGTDVVFLADADQNYDQEKFKYVSSFIVNTTEKLNMTSDCQIAVGVYSESYFPILGFGESLEDDAIQKNFDSKLDFANEDPATNTGIAINFVLKTMFADKESKKPRRIVLFTNGGASADELKKAEDKIKKFKGADSFVVVYSFGVAGDEKTSLEKISSGEEYFFETEESALDEAGAGKLALLLMNPPSKEEDKSGSASFTATWWGLLLLLATQLYFLIK